MTINDDVLFEHCSFTNVSWMPMHLNIKNTIFKIKFELKQCQMLSNIFMNYKAFSCTYVVLTKSWKLNFVTDMEETACGHNSLVIDSQGTFT